MGHERWFRGQHDGRNRSFDWLAAARQHGVPEPVARALYERALQQAHGAAPGHVQASYLALLVEARREASRPSPGKVTRTMRLRAEQAGRSRGPRISPLTGRSIAPGKCMLTSYLEPAGRGRQNTERQRIEDVAGQLGALGLSGLRVGTVQPFAAPMTSERQLHADLAVAFGQLDEFDALDDVLEARQPAANSEAATLPAPSAARDDLVAPAVAPLAPLPASATTPVVTDTHVLAAEAARSASHDAQARYDEARARHLAQRLATLAQRPLPSRDDLLLLLAAAGPDVARAAVSELAMLRPANGARSSAAAIDAVTGGVASQIAAGTWNEGSSPDSAIEALRRGLRAAATQATSQGAAALATGLAADLGRRVGRATRQRWQQSSLRPRVEQHLGAMDGWTGGALSRMRARIEEPVATFLDGSRLPAQSTRGPASAGHAVAADRDPGATRMAAIEDDLVQYQLDALDTTGGTPLPPELARRMSALLGHDVAHVRIHTDAQAAGAAALLGARAFTIGTHIYFHAGHWAPGTAAFERLLVHELTHVVQFDQGRLQPAHHGRFRITDPGESTEREARTAEDRVQAAPAAAPAAPAAAPAAPAAAPAAAPRARSGQSSGHRAPGNASRGAQAGGRVVSRGLMSSLVRQVSPGLADLIDQGPMGMLKSLIESGLRTFLSPLTGMLSSVGEVVSNIQSSFAQAFGFIKGLFAGDAKCCEAFVQGIDKLRSLAKSIAENPVVEAVKSAFGKANESIQKIATLVLSPAFDLVKDLLGSAWSGITGLAQRISGWLEPVKELSSDAWNWAKGALGIGGDGEGGILSWLTDKAKSVWDSIKTTLAPVAGPLKVVGGVLVALSPIGPVVALIKYGPKLVEAVKWLWANRGNPDIVKKAHAEMGGTILPGLLSAAQGFGQTLDAAAKWLVTQATSLSTGLLQLLGSITGVPLLGLAQQAVQMFSSAAQQLAQWATTTVSEAAATVQTGFTKLAAFVKPYASVLTSIGLAIVNPSMIPMILAGHAWQALPDCIKAPIIDLLLDAVIAVLQATPSLIMFGPLWPLLKSGIIGFLQGLRNQDAKVKEQVSNKLAKIVSGGSPAFLLGFVKGFLIGVWEGLTDPFVLIWSAVEGLGSLVSWLGGLASQALETTATRTAPAPAQAPAPASAPASGGATSDTASGTAPAAQQPAPPQAQENLPSRAELGQRVGAMKGELEPEVQQVTSGFMPAMREVFQGGEGLTFEGLMAKLGEMWSSIQGAIQSAAGDLATKACQFLVSGEAEGKLGESVGWLAGTIAFEVLLGVLTAGAWQPVSAAGKALKAFARILDWTGEALGAAFKLLGKIGGLLIDALKGLGKMIGNAGGAARQVLDALGNVGRKLIAFADELLGRFGRGVAGEGAERTAKEAAQEASERTAKEAAQQGTEAATKEGMETAAEQGTKQADEVGGQATKQGDETAEQATKQGDETAEQATKQGDETAEQTTKQGDEADQAGKQGDEADQGGKKNGDQPDMTEKVRVAAEAAVESNLMEAAGTPALAIATALKRTFQPRYRWIKDFEAERVGPDKHVIWMIASKLKVDTVLDRVVSGRSKDRFTDDEWKNLTQEQRDYINEYRRRNPESTKSDQFLRDCHTEGWKFTDKGDLYHPQSGKYPPPEDPHRAKYKDQPAPDSPAAKEMDDFKRHMSENPSEARKAAAEAREKSAAECDLIRNKQGKYADMTEEQRKRALELEMENLRTASQTLGEQAGKEYGDKVLKAQGFEPVKLPAGEANNFDQVYYNPKTGEVVVVECKGATSGLGDRFAKDNKTRVQQGTEWYLEAVIAKLKGTEAYDLLRDAFRRKQKGIRYLVVRQPVNANGALGVVDVKEFNVWR